MKIRKLSRRDRVEWVLDYYSGGKRIRKWFKSKALAEAEQGNLKDQTKQCGEAWVDLSPEERNDIMSIFVAAKRENIALRQIWEAFKSGKLDAAPMVRKTLQEAITDTIAAKTTENRRERYIKSLDDYLNKFAAGRTEMFIDRFGVAEIESWFDDRKEASSTRNSNLGRLGAMFDLCWRRGYIKENPCLRVAKIRIDEKPPIILSPTEAKAILVACISKSPEFLPYIVLGMFAGIRPEEMEKLKWGDIDFKRATVNVDAAAAKVRQRRIVAFHPTAKLWLKLFKPGTPEELILPSESTIKRNRRAIRDAAGIEWHQDILRHTAASYLLQHFRNADEVALQLGNSARILEKHYKQLVTDQDCRKFWALTPGRVQQGKK